MGKCVSGDWTGRRGSFSTKEEEDAADEDDEAGGRGAGAGAVVMTVKSLISLRE